MFLTEKNKVVVVVVVAAAAAAAVWFGIKLWFSKHCYRKHWTSRRRQTGIVPSHLVAVFSDVWSELFTPSSYWITSPWNPLPSGCLFCWNLLSYIQGLRQRVQIGLPDRSDVGGPRAEGHSRSETIPLTFGVCKGSSLNWTSKVFRFCRKWSYNPFFLLSLNPWVREFQSFRRFWETDHRNDTLPTELFGKRWIYIQPL